MILALTNYFPTLQAVKATSTIIINADGSISPTDAPIQRNGNLYTLTNDVSSDTDGIVIQRDNAVLDGAGYTIQGTKMPASRGIYVQGQTYVTIRNIKIKTFESGILLDSFSNCDSIMSSKIEGNDYGIECLAYSDNTTISRNNITANNLIGIWIVGSSNDTITGNIIAGTTQTGIDLESSFNDTIYHNNFIGNTIQFSLYDSTAAWDNGYPSGGNYWSDYSGTDVHSGPNQNMTGSDGIGDTPYIFDLNNVDNYPLMDTVNNIAVVNVFTSKTIVGEGYKVYINVTIQNEGWTQQTTKLAVYLNTSILSNMTSLVLMPSNLVILNFTWQTTAGARGNYIVKATLDPAPGEVDTLDNTCNASQPVKVTIVGDVNGDGSVDIYDAITLAGYFNSIPSSAKWNGNADINSDNVVDIYDAIILAGNFNKKI